MTTATFTVPDTFSYDAYFVDTSVNNTSIVITLPTTVGNGGGPVQFISVTSVQGGDTNSNTITVVTAVPASQSIIVTGVSQSVVPKNGYLMLRAQDNTTTGLWLTSALNQYQDGAYGDGSDGTVTATTSTLGLDMYYQNLIVPNGVTLNTNSFRVFVNGLLTMEGTGHITNNGTVGGNGAAGTAGAAGAAGATNVYTGGGGGGAGGTNSAVGAAAGSALNAVGGTGGNGGATVAPAAAHLGGAGGNSPVTAANGSTKVVKSTINAISGLMPSGAKYASGGGGGGGAGGAAGSGGGGGGGGGGILMLAARFIVVTGTGSSITANGGTGGNGGGAVGSGGGGGGGGAVIIITQTPNLTTNFTGLTVTANGGAGGTGVGTGSNAGVVGAAGVVNFLSS